MNERLGGFRQALVVRLEPSPSAEPCKRSLHDPAPRQDRKATLSFGLANDLHPDLSPWSEAPDPLVQTAAGISAISPNYAQAPEPSCQHTQQNPGCCPVLRIGGRDDDEKYEAERIHQDVPFAARDLFRGIIASYTTLFTGLHRLAVDDRTARFRISPCCLPHGSANTVVNLSPCPITAP